MKKFTKKRSKDKKGGLDQYEKDIDVFLKKLDKANILDKRDREIIRKQVEKDLNRADRLSGSKRVSEVSKIFDKYDGKVKTIINRKGRLTKKIVKGDGKGYIGKNKSRSAKILKTIPDIKDYL